MPFDNSREGLGLQEPNLRSADAHGKLVRHFERLPLCSLLSLNDTLLFDDTLFLLSLYLHMILKCLSQS